MKRMQVMWSLLTDVKTCVWAKWTMILLCVAVLVARKSYSLIYPQFYAEDGTVFFFSAYNFGAESLFMSHADYIHLIPRLTALFVTLLPLELWPLLYSLSSFLWAGWAIYILLNNRLELPCKPLLALCVALWPTTGEIFGALAYVQWTVAYVPLVILLRRAPKNKREAMGDGVALLLCGLTSPLALVYAPFFLWRMVKHREQNLTVLSSVAAVFAAFVQGMVYFLLQTTAGRRGGEPITETNYHPLAIAQMFLSRVFDDMFWLNDSTFMLYILFVAATVLAFLLLRHKHAAGRNAMLALVGFTLLFYAIGAARTGGATLGYLHDSGDRYFVLPRLMVLWVCVLGLDYSRWARCLSCAVIAAVLCALPQRLMTYEFEGYEDFRPIARLAYKASAERPVIFHVSPWWQSNAIVLTKRPH